MSCFFLDAMREKSKTLPAWGLRCFLRRRILCCRLGDSQPSHQGIFVRICCCEVYPALKQTVHLHASWRCMLDPLGISLPESKSHVWKETCALIGFVLNPLNFSTRCIFFSPPWGWACWKPLSHVSQLSAIYPSPCRRGNVWRWPLLSMFYQLGKVQCESSPARADGKRQFQRGHGCTVRAAPSHVAWQSGIRG